MGFSNLISNFVSHAGQVTSKTLPGFKGTRDRLPQLGQAITRFVRFLKKEIIRNRRLYKAGFNFGNPSSKISFQATKSAPASFFTDSVLPEIVIDVIVSPWVIALTVS